MTVRRETSSDWMVRFDTDQARGQSIVLDGNVLDDSLYNGEYMPLPRFLNSYLRSVGFEVIGTVDIVDGFRLASPDEMGIG